MSRHNDHCRSCARCGAKSSQNDLTFHRFPKGKRDDFEVAQKWGRWCYPNQDWSTFESVNSLYTSHRMLCGKHFLPEYIYKSGILRKGTVPSLDISPTQTAAYAATPDHGDTQAGVLQEDAVEVMQGDAGEVLQEEAIEVKQEQDEQASLAHVCRVCLRYCSDARNTIPLMINGKPTKAANALTAFSTLIKISANEKLPMQMCIVCAREAFRAERFYSRVEDTHARLSSLAPDDIVRYSLSLAHYFPKGTVSNKLAEDDESAFISLRYDGDQHLELCFNNELEKRQKSNGATQSTITDQRGTFWKTPDLDMKYASESKEPFFDVIKKMPLAQTPVRGSKLKAGRDVLSFKIITDPYTTFRCSECSTDFVTRLEADYHVDSAHGPVPAYVCHECTQTIASKRLLREHLRRHSGVKPYECQRCHDKFYCRGDQRKHYLVCAVPGATDCEKSGEHDETAVTSWKYDGDHHVELNKLSTSIENPETLITYDEDRKRKRQKTDHTTHNTITDTHKIFLKTQITENTSYENNDVQCDPIVNDDLARQMLEMEDHSLKEELISDAPEAMSVAQTAASGSEMNAGCDPLSFKLIADPYTTFRCCECNTDFVTRLEAEYHVDSAHGSVPAYVCHECSQTIATKRLLREHLRRHSGVKPYECQRCHSRFDYREDRLGHLLVCTALGSNDCVADNA